MTARQSCGTVLLAALLAAASLLAADKAPTAKDQSAHWAQWRGPSGQGYSDDRDVPLTWGEKENLLWKTKLPGAGNSTPIVWGDQIFLTSSGGRGAERYVLCVRASDGKLLWQQTAAKDAPQERTHAWNGHASASCTTDGTYVYAFFGTPGLFCYDFEGKLVWKHSFGTFRSNTGWGNAASPFLFEDLVIQNCDTDGATAPAPADSKLAPMALVALDKKSGKVRWSTPRNQGQGFSTPRLVPVANGRVDLVLNGQRALCGYDPRTGKELWRCARHGTKDNEKFGEPMPTNDDTTLFVLSGRPGPCQAIKLPGEGDVTKSHVLWEHPRGRHRDVASPIIWEGKVYCCDRGGVLSCLDLKTGKEHYARPLGSRSAKSMASPVAVQGKLLWLLDGGTTVVVEPGTEFKVVGRNKLGDETSLDFGASPAIAAGRMYLRSQSYLYCIGKK